MGQQAPRQRLLVVTADTADPNTIRAWQAGSNGGDAQKLWEAQPRTLGQASYQEWRREVPAMSSPGLPVIADYDDDGINELLVVDPLGLTVYGRSPAYYPFAQAAMVGVATVLVADVDGDRRSEIVTQRSLGLRKPNLRVIEIWKRSSQGLQLAWSREMIGEVSWTLEWADVDNDGTRELLTAYDTVVILKRTPTGQWDVAAELPNIGLPDRLGGKFSGTMIDVVRVGDVDGDGKNEIIATGNSGVVTVYKHRIQHNGREHYPVLWQSPRLSTGGLMPLSPGQLPMVLTQGLAVGDVDGDDGALEILVATAEFGVRPGESNVSNGGYVHLFKFDGQRGFTRTWLSDWTFDAGIPALAVADLDGDGRMEFIHNGNSVYKSDPGPKRWVPYRFCSGCPSYGNAVAGLLPELREPASAIRLVPVRWSLPGGALVRGRSASVALTLRSIWAEAKDVMVTVSAVDSSLRLAPQTLRVPAVPVGGTVTLPPFTMEGGDAKAQPDSGGMMFGDLLLDIRAAGGYRQSLRLSVLVTEPKAAIPTELVAR